MAYHSDDFTLTQIGDHFDLHYVTVSPAARSGYVSIQDLTLILCPGASGGAGGSNAGNTGSGSGNDCGSCNDVNWVGSQWNSGPDSFGSGNADLGASLESLGAGVGADRMGDFDNIQIPPNGRPTGSGSAGPFAPARQPGAGCGGSTGCTSGQGVKPPMEGVEPACFIDCLIVPLIADIKLAVTLEELAEEGPIYPPNNGFPPGEGNPATVLPGQLVDRYGSPSGRYLSPQGTPFSARSLPPGAQNNPLNTYRVLTPIEVDAGPAVSWFGQPGGGMQYYLGNRTTVQNLIDEGALEPIPGINPE